MNFLYVLPSISAISIKILILFRYRSDLKKSNLWIKLMFICFFGMNIIELSGFALANNPGVVALVLLSLFYVLTIFACHSFVGIANYADGNRLELADRVIVIFAFVFSFVAVVPGWGLSGAQGIGYTVTRVPGEYYFIIQIGLLLPLSVALSLLLKNVFSQKPYIYKRPSKIILIALLPPIAVIALVVTAMFFGTKINVAIFMSLSINWTLWVFIVTQSADGQYMLMAYTPGTRENRFMRTLIKYSASPQDGLKPAKLLVEEEMIRAAMELSDGNKSRAADKLGISRNTLDRRLMQFHMPLE